MQRVSREVTALNYNFQGYQAKTDLHVYLDTIILGNTSLERINPVIDWRAKTMTVRNGGYTYKMVADRNSGVS